MATIYSIIIKCLYVTVLCYSSATFITTTFFATKFLHLVWLRCCSTLLVHLNRKRPEVEITLQTQTNIAWKVCSIENLK